MVIFDDIFEWEGWGGKLKLARGKCRLWIFDLNQGPDRELVHLRPIVVVASDLPREGMLKGEVSVRSASSHIATVVCRRFAIAPSRMQFVEYTPAESYGPKGEYIIQAGFDAVAFTWKDDLALFPRSKPLASPLLEIVRGMITGCGDSPSSPAPA
jgi:hypothetical protein